MAIDFEGKGLEIEKRPIVQAKVGLWINREKMRRILDKFSMLYIVVFVVIAMMASRSNSWGIVIGCGVFILPLLLMQWSLYKWRKLQNDKK